jgi:DNA-binding NtrC family response regulator
MNKSHIMIVEDDHLILEVLEDIVETLDYIPTCVQSGAAAFAAAKENPDIKLVISDMEVPGMHGTEIVAGLIKIIPDIKVIFSTGYSERELDIDRDSKNFVAFIKKPFDISDIQAAIEKAIPNN